MNLLEKGQYLGNTSGDFENNYFSIKSSLHQKSESEFHVHNHSYLSILLNGIYSETSRSNSKRIFPSEIIFRPANYIHKNTFETNSVKCLNIEFNAEWFRKLDAKRLQDFPTINQINNFPFLFRLITDFIQYNHTDIVEDLLLDFIHTIKVDSTNHIRTPWLQKLTAILDNEIDRVHSLQSLSERIHLHPNYMTRIFKAKTGMTIGQYQIEKKLSSATKKLLLDNNTICDIGIENGFFDEAHFIRTFKSKYGITPHQFRLIVKS